MISFESEKKIKLDMTSEEVISLIGICYSETLKTPNSYKIKYGIDLSNMKKSELLKRCNMPSYFADYDFIDNKLVRFKFGFEYP